MPWPASGTVTRKLRSGLVIAAVACGWSHASAQDERALERERALRERAEVAAERAREQLEAERERGAVERTRFLKEVGRLRDLVNEVQIDAAEQIDELKQDRAELGNDVSKSRAVIRQLRVRLARALADGAAEPEVPPVEDEVERGKVPVKYRVELNLDEPLEGSELPFTEFCQFVADVVAGSVHVDRRNLGRAGIGYDAFVTVPKGQQTADSLLVKAAGKVDDRIRVHYDGPVAVISLGSPVALRSAGRTFEVAEGPSAQRTAVHNLGVWSHGRTEFHETPFGECLEFLSDVTDVPVEVDWKGLDRVGVDSSTEITLRVGRVPHRTALNLVLLAADDRLTYTVRGGRIRVIVAEGVELPPAADRPPAERREPPKPENPFGPSPFDDSK